MFWKGFEKKAIRLGAKGVNPLNSAGKMEGNKPTSMVSTVAAYKPTPLPTAKQHSAKDISHPILPSSGTIK